MVGVEAPNFAIIITIVFPDGTGAERVTVADVLEVLFVTPTEVTLTPEEEIKLPAPVREMLDATAVVDHASKHANRSLARYFILSEFRVINDGLHRNTGTGVDAKRVARGGFQTAKLVSTINQTRLRCKLPRRRHVGR